MKSIIQISLDKSLLEKVTIYAASQNCGVSDLVENHLASITEISKFEKKYKRKNIIDLVEELPKPNIDIDCNLKIEYFKTKS